MNYFQKNWKTIVVAVWIIFSAWYILDSMWNNFQMNVVQNSYLAWQNDTIAQIINKAADKSCQPFNIYNQSSKVNLVNVDCLQKAQSEAQSQTASAQDKPSKK